MYDDSSEKKPNPTTSSIIIANHLIIDNYETIPDFYIDKVKEMLLCIPGESHGRAYLYGLQLLEQENTEYAVSVTWTLAPNTQIEFSTGDSLRAVRVYKNDITSLFWQTYGGEEDFWTNTDAIDMMQEFLTFQSNNNNPVTAFGFGWCWDMTGGNANGETDPRFGTRWAGWSYLAPLPVNEPFNTDGQFVSRPWGIDEQSKVYTNNTVSLEDYINAVQIYNTNQSGTITFFTTGPVDGCHGSEEGYQRYLKHQAIREYVNENGGVLFDYADILCWYNGIQYIDTWNGHQFKNGDPNLASGGAGYDGGDGGCHITEAGCLKLGKALWWMLARLAGWDGN